jgi:hypothetical protein
MAKAAPDKKKSSGRVTKAVAFTPLALALLMQNATLPGGKPTAKPQDESGQPASCDEVGDFRDCHARYPTGCSNSAKPSYDAYLNLMKNQLIPPEQPPEGWLTLADFKRLDSKLPDGLQRGNHGDYQKEMGQLGEGHVFGAVAYLYYAQKQGAESVNCQLCGDLDVDFHIGVGFDAALAEQVRQLREARKAIPKDLKKQLQQASVVVEMTPHFRDQHEQHWTVAALQQVLGWQIKLAGQLLVDNEHLIPAQNCAAAGADMAKCWRATAWELHPVTQFKVCKAKQGCAQDGADWEELSAFDPDK